MVEFPRLTAIAAPFPVELSKNMNNSAITDKLRKLLRMQRGGTVDEIATALRLAQDLAAKHGIDLSQVDPNVEPSADAKVGHERDILGSRMAQESKFAASICVGYFNVEVILSQVRYPRIILINFVGTSTDIAVAKYVFGFLRSHFRACWKNRTNRRLRDRDAFLYGMYLGVCSKLHSRRSTATGSGLVAVDLAITRRKSYVEEHFPKTTEQEIPKSDSIAAQRAGWTEGKKTEIRSAIDKSEASAPLQLTAG